MSKKDYVLIARVINAQRRHFKHNMAFEALDVISEQLSLALAEENPRFNRDKFLNACGHPVYENY